jgi:UDP-N-acetylmuramyl pentapeptide phosphotransferase/UDP-N-acetylglucosamine-1-phosphate transferase
LIWIVGVTNLYNFLDGIDGFAGLQGVVVGLAVAFLYQSGLFVVIGFAVVGES